MPNLIDMLPETYLKDVNVQKQLSTTQSFSDRLQKNKDARFSTDEINGVHAAFKFFGNINDRHVQQFSNVGCAVAEMYVAHTALTGVNALTGLAALHPIAMFATAALTIFNTFRRKKDRSGEALAAIMQNLQIISEQVYHVHVELREFRKESYENQLIILKTVHAGFSQIEQGLHSIEADMQEFHAITASAIAHLESTLNQWGKTISYEVKTTSLYPYNKLIHRMLDWLEKREVENPTAAIPQLINRVADWIGFDTQRNLSPRLALALYSGMDLMTGIDYQKVTTVLLPFVEFGNNVVDERRGFLASYADKTLDAAPKREGKALPYNMLVDPTLCLPMAMVYCKLRDNFPEYVLDPEYKNLASVHNLVQHNLNYLLAQQRNTALFEKLFSQYQGVLDQINKIIQDEFITQNSLINDKIDITVDIDTTLNAFKGKRPIQQFVKGGTAYTYYGFNTHHHSVHRLIYGWGLPVNEMVNIVCQTYNDSQIGQVIGAFTGTAVDIASYNNATTAHDFPAEFLALEHLDLIKLEHTYHTEYLKPNARADIINLFRYSRHKEEKRRITVDCIYKDGDKKNVLHVDQHLELALPDNQVTHQDVKIHTENLLKAKEKLASYILELRKLALANALAKMAPLLVKLEAFLRLLKAYAIEVGFQEEQFKLLEQLPGCEKIQTQLKDYLQSTNIETAIPYCKYDSTPTKQAFLEKMQQTGYLQNRAVIGYQTILQQLDKLKIDEPIKSNVAQIKKTHSEHEAKKKQESDQYKNGIDLGNSLATSLIIMALESANHHQAANILIQRDKRTTEQDGKKTEKNLDEIPTSLKQGVLQALSLKVIESTPILLQHQQIEAVIWLNEFSREHISKAVLSSTNKSLADVIRAALPAPNGRSNDSGLRRGFFNRPNVSQEPATGRAPRASNGH